MAHKIQKDHYPQIFPLPTFTLQADGSFAESSATRTPVDVESALAMEVLQVDFLHSQPILGTAATVLSDISAGIIMQVTNRSQSAIVFLNEPDLIATWRQQAEVVAMEATETGAGYSRSPMSKEVVLGGNSGLGVLTAAPEIYLSGQADSDYTANFTGSARLHYRLVKLTAAEMFGMIQTYLSA